MCNFPSFSVPPVTIPIPGLPSFSGINFTPQIESVGLPNLPSAPNYSLPPITIPIPGIPSLPSVTVALDLSEGLGFAFPAVNYSIPPITIPISSIPSLPNISLPTPSCPDI